VPLRPRSRALGVLLCYCGIARRLALKIHNWRSTQTVPLPGFPAKNHQGPQ
jgi:hypothetical protein